MPDRLPRVTPREVIAALERAGWQHVRTTGSHRHFKHPDRPGLVTVPVHPGETIFPAILKSILRQAGLTAEEFRTLLG
jgi:predicted RNA binding protein YcfA (HicA-like mRNA interferase family)